ncbi:MAG: hypothetical protein HY862_09565 [Chloroflexi bacterium]|nr:hypothetical protein [Chloroflexota bacterium]
MRLKNELHRFIDPLLAWRNGAEWRSKLADLPDGEYRVSLDVPYIPQFASPERINDYIHHGYDGMHDPNWAVFGSPDPQEYAFWSHRVCALAVIKMAIEAHQPNTPAPTLWQLTQAGLAEGGYVVCDTQGRWVDEGWYFAAQVKLAAQYGLQLTGYSYASPLGICYHLWQGHLVAATVTPELGEHKPQTRRYGGHSVLLHGFRWEGGHPTDYLLHNPSGRYLELQANVWLPAQKFQQAYAYRFAAFTTEE